MEGWESRVKDCLQQSIKCQIKICTKLERIYTINSQLLRFRAKKLAGWMGGRVDGRESRVKDCVSCSDFVQKSLLDGWKGGRKEGRKDGRESRVKDCLQQSKTGLKVASW